MSEEKNNLKKEIVSKNKLLESGIYFGHHKSKWNPKMKPYILTTKKGTHIIDITKTQKTIEFAYSIVKKFAEREATFIFVGTRRHAKETIKFNALRTNSFYVSERWLGGTLTNNKTIFARVKRMFELEKLAESNFEGYTKKEGVLFNKELEKLQRNLLGIKNMKSKPNVMIVANPKDDEIAIKEAKKLGIKVIGIVDTNADPNLVDVAIPGNDDSIKSVSLVITIIADAIASVKGGDILFAYQDDSKIILPSEPKVKKPLKRKFGSKIQYRTSNFKKDDLKFDKKPQFEKNQNFSKNFKKEKSELEKQKDFPKEFKKEIPNTNEEEPKKFNKTNETDEDLLNLNIIQLKEKAKKQDIKGYSKMKKDELIKVLS